MNIGAIALSPVTTVKHEEYSGCVTQDGVFAKAVVSELGGGFEAWIKIGRVGSSGCTVAHVYADTPQDACDMAYAAFLEHVSALGLALLPSRSVQS